ncbi:MAG: group 1 glycosyl transferase [Pseudozobellia sp.]|nr:group 1 glycosyl transferase [Pseudozobellia sp.]MBG50375.1 group 1 glycosyl transferase [Pseudozobellia sp.]|tara:strand:- start:1865 stop:2938 length:1074 start_codon:yes stop_codon:yes gene_type:complete
MKIDFVIASLSGGGAERVMVLLANKLSSLGYRVNIITFSPGLAYDLDDDVELTNLHKSRIKNHSLRRFVSLLRYYKTKENRPDVVISFITLINLITIIAAKLFNIKVICSEHNSYLRAQSPVALTRFTRKVFYPKADFVTVLTAFDVPYYESLKVNVKVMPNPCTFEPNVLEGLEKNKTILAVGSLDRYHHKGFDNLIDIADRVLRKRPEWKLKIIGGGDQGLKFLQEKVEKLNLQDSIIFTGFRTDVKEIMAQSEVFILSSRYEGLPMVLLEAMSQGMACIAYDCKTGPSDIIVDNKNGILVEDQNLDQMSIQLANLLDDQNLRESLSENGINSLKNFSIDSVISKWEVLFDSLKD